MGGGADSASTLAAKHGGRASRRSDGLPIGSPEAREADLARDRERKRRKRLGLPPLASIKAGPSLGVSAGEPPPLVAQSVPGDFPAEAGGVAVVPWTADVLRPLFEQGVPLVEDRAVASLTAKARAAQLDRALVTELEKGAAWHPLAKQQIIEGGSAVAAKWLNKSGVSAEHADEVRLLGGIAAVIAGHRTIAAKLDELARTVGSKTAANPAQAENPSK